MVHNVAGKILMRFGDKNNQPDIAVIIPVLNESRRLLPLLDWLTARGEHLKVVIVDGGSEDDTPAICGRYHFRLIRSAAGRARQMNAGAAQIRADIYWFIHADCLPPDDAIDAIGHALSSGHDWGRFDVRLTGKQRVYRLIEWLMNKRSCLTGVATGDQGIFMRGEVYRKIGGFPRIALMEDVAICKRLRKISRPACLRSRLQVSSRRWQQYGIFKTICLMWRLRLQYFLGASPQYLHARYYACRNAGQVEKHIVEEE